LMEPLGLGFCKALVEWEEFVVLVYEMIRVMGYVR
jgi:hypothetical protein